MRVHWAEVDQRATDHRDVFLGAGISQEVPVKFAKRTQGLKSVHDFRPRNLVLGICPHENAANKVKE